MREPVTKVFRRAGCGKPARPVRRGDGVSRINPLLSVLLYRSSLHIPAALIFSHLLTSVRGQRDRPVAPAVQFVFSGAKPPDLCTKMHN